MSDNLRLFPGISGPKVSIDSQPDPAVIAFCEDLVARAKAGKIQGIAIAMVKDGGTCCDGWMRGGIVDCCDKLMAAITYLQNRYASTVNKNDVRDERPPSGA